MKLIENFNSWEHIYETERNLESFLDNVYKSILNENIGAILGSPIKYMKLKKAAKEYQTSLVQKAINNLDFEKKKAAGNLDPNQKEVLATANKQKNQALSDKTTALSQKIDSLATTDGLKAVANIAKNKSQIAAAEIAAKTADGEEAKALKLKIQGLNKKVAASQEELEDYKKDAEDSEPEQQNLDNVKSKPKKEEPKPEVKTPPKVEPNKEEPKPEVKTPPKVEPNKEEPKPEVKTPPKVEPKKEEPESRELTDKEKESLTKAEAGLAKAKEAGDANKVKRYEDLIKGIKDTKKLGESLDLFKIDEALKSIEATSYISESIATRFKRAMDQRGPRF